MIKERYKKYAAIIQRAKEEGLHVNDKLSVLMDIESADRKFNIRLDEWLQADLFNFTHDFYGIIDHIVRDQFPATNFEGFIPRFASKKIETQEKLLNERLLKTKGRHKYVCLLCIL